MEVNELEKAKLKRALKKSIKKKNKMKNWKKKLTAASIIAGLSLTTFLTLPAYAGKHTSNRRYIPIFR
jgi:hypothetical protein